MVERDDAPFDFPNSSAWEKWLSKHHLQDGWIDSHRKSFDEKHYLQRYSLRTSQSPWSKINVDKAEALIASGRMQAPGLAEIRKAKADGRWAAAYESQKTAGIPPDFTAALKKSAKAKRAFDALDKTGQYAVVLPILKAATPATRAARVQKAIGKLAGTENP